MNFTALWQTILLCCISIALEMFSATKTGKKWFETLKQPKFSFPFSLWYVAGGFYYLICGIIAYRQLSVKQSFFSPEVILLTIMMLLNGCTNFILFKYRSLKGFYFVLYPFMALFSALMVILWHTDFISALLALAYLLWLGYDLYYFYNLWKINHLRIRK